MKVYKAITLFILIFIIAFTGCQPQERIAMQSIRFDSPEAVNLEVNGNSVSERIDAVRRYMAFLDNQSGEGFEVDFSAGFEESCITMRVEIGVERWWKIDFHLVWPSPRMNNQHFNQVKLVCWTAALEKGKPGSLTAVEAKKRASDKIIELTEQFARANENRVCMVSPTE